jgi:hypothetical protein
MTTLRVPLRRFQGEAMQSMIFSMYSQVPTRNAILDDQGWTGRRVLGYRLPAWQRPEVWSDAQCVKFIESIYLGANIGAFMVNESNDMNIDNLLVDGQQRLRSMERYWNNELAVPDENGELWRWGDLDPSTEQARMLRIAFPWIQVRYSDEALLKEVYNIHNFSGTPHTTDQMAVGFGSLKSALPGIRNSGSGLV